MKMTNEPDDGDRRRRKIVSPKTLMTFNIQRVIATAAVSLGPVRKLLVSSFFSSGYHHLP